MFSDSKEKSRSYQPLQSYNSTNRSDDNRTYNNRREPPTYQDPPPRSGRTYQDPPPRSGRNDNRANGRRSEFRENDRSEWDSRQNYNSDRSSQNNDRGKSYTDSKKGQGFSGDRDRYDGDRRRDRGQQRQSYKGGSNEKGNWENKQDRGDNSDRYNESGNRPKSGYQDRKQGRQQDYDQNRPRSEMSGRSTKQDLSNQNARNPPPSKDSYNSGNQFSQPPPSLPQYNPDVPPPPLPQQMNNFLPNQKVSLICTVEVVRETWRGKHILYWIIWNVGFLHNKKTHTHQEREVGTKLKN